MNVKAVGAGGLAFFAVSFLFAVIAAIPGEALMEDLYQNTKPFWRESVTEENFTETPLFLAWIAHKLLFALGVSLLYGWARPSLKGPGWKRGVLLGLATWPLVVATYVGQWTVFNLPGELWIWWSLFYLLNAPLSGAALGVVFERIAPVHTLPDGTR